jgi:hypothetical protein
LLGAKQLIQAQITAIGHPATQVQLDTGFEVPLVIRHDARKPAKRLMLTAITNTHVRVRMLQCTLRRNKPACYQMAFVWVQKGCVDCTDSVGDDRVK